MLLLSLCKIKEQAIKMSYYAYLTINKNLMFN